MKKLDFLRVVSLAVVFVIGMLCTGYAQGNDDFNTLTSSSSYATQTTTSGWVCLNANVGQGTYTFGTCERKHVCINGKTTAVGSITSPTLAGGCGTLSFCYGYPYAENYGAHFRVEIQNEQNQVVFSDEVTRTNDQITKGETYNYSAEVNISGNFTIHILNLSPSNSTNNKDRLAVSCISWTANDPIAVATPVFTPVAGLYYNTQTVAIATATDDATIYYTTDGTTPDATSAVYTEPITVSTATTIKAIAIKDTNMSMVVTANYSFPTVSDNVAALKANGVNNEIYKLNTILRVIYQNANYLFVQDNTGALLIYGNTGKTYNAGDYIYGGIYGKFSPYQGMNEIVPVSGAPEMADGDAGSAITPIVVTVADLLDNYDQYESKLVTIQNVTFTGGKNFAQNGNAMSYYNRFSTSTISSVDANTLGNITGIVAKYGTTIQIYPRTNADIELAAQLPLTVDFDQNTDDNWVISNGENTNKWYIGQAQGFDNNKLYISSTNGATNKYANATSEVSCTRFINVPANGAKLTFDARVNGDNNDKLTVRIGNTVLGTFFGNNDWTNYTVDIDASYAGTQYLSFVWSNNASTDNQFPAAVDNINIVPVTCLAPSNLAAAVNGTSATITWTAAADQTAWTFEYKLANHSEWYSMPATTTSVTLNNLQGNSTYDMRVKANCGDQSSLWTIGTFAIDCQNGSYAPAMVTVGNGTSGYYYAPFNNYYKHSWNECIYPANTLQGAGTINSISWNCSNSTSRTFSSMKIYMGTRSSSTFASTTDWTPASSLQLVYEGSNVTVGSSTGWQEFVLNTPFEYNGTDNLVVVVSKSQDGYSSALKYYYTSTSNACMYRQSDSYTDYAQHPGTSSGSRSSYRADIKLNMVIGSCADVESCPAVTNVNVTNVTPNSAEVSWNATASQTNFIVEYKTADATDWMVANVSNATDYTITGLAQLTDYMVRVKANCGTNDLSEPVAANFTTTGNCPIVTNIANANNATTTTLTWTAGGSETAWTIQFKPATASDWTSLNVSNPSVVLGGLLGSTEYNVRVKALCDPDDTENQSAWVNYNFTTDCEASDLPFEELFSVSRQPDCWSNEGFTFNGSTARTSTINNWLMTPPMNLPVSNGIFYVSFNAIATGNYDLMISENGTNAADFVTVATSSNQGDVLFAIPQNYNGKLVYIKIVNGNNNSLTIDNFRVSECPYIPTNVVAGNITHNSAAIAWNADAAVNAWNVQYKLSSDAAWQMVVATNNQITLTGLQANSDYNVRVQSACSATAQSVWSATTSFSTDCAPISFADIPWTENFDNNTFSTSQGRFLECWNRYTSNSSHYVYLYGDSYVSAPYSLDFHHTPDCFDIGIMPALAEDLNVNQLMLNFYLIKSGTTAVFEVGVMTDPADYTTFTPITTMDVPDIETWAPVSVLLSDYTGNGKYIAFRVSNGNSCGYRVDNLEVAFIPNCPAPTSLTASNVTSTSVDLSWNGNGSPMGYIVSYKSNNDAVWTSTNLISGTSTTITGLNDAETYQIKVKAFCGAGNESDYTEAITVETPCIGGISVQIGTGSTSSYYIPSYSYYNYSLVEQIYLASEIGTNSSISKLSFYNAGSTKTRNYSIYMKHTTKTSFSGSYDWESVGSAELVYSGNVTMNGGAWTTITLNTPFNYNGTDNLLLVFDDNTGSYSSGLSGRCTSQSDDKTLRVYSDGTNYNPSSPSSYYGTLQSERLDVIFEGCPVSCLSPTALTATNVSASTATITWNAGADETEWDVQYGPAGFTTGDGTTINATSTTATINGLTNGTSYDFYVRAVCSENDKSIWIGPLSLTTLSCDNGCVYTVTMMDEYGDGWNGASINVYDNGVLNSNITCSGDNTVEQIISCGGQISFAWVSGSWDGECSFNITDASGATLFSCSDGSEMSSGSTFYTAQCGSSTVCVAPSNLTVANITSATADLSWTAAADETDYVVEYAEGGTSNWLVASVTGTNYTLSNLAGNTTYDVRVKTNCGANSESDYTAIVTFTTPCNNGTNVVLGTGTSTNAIPFQTCYKNSKAESIYLASEIGSAGEISSITWSSASTTSHQPSELKIYLGTTTRSSISSSSDWTPASDLTLVYSSSNATIGGYYGDQTFFFDTPFTYNGTDNLVVVVTRKAYSYNCTANMYCTSMSSMSMYRQSDSDSGYGDVTNTTTGSVNSYRPNIKFAVCPKAADIAITNVATAPDACEINQPVVITVQNNGFTDEVSSFEAYYALNDGAEVHETVTLATPLTYQQTVTYTFNTIPVYEAGANVITARVQIPNDETESNNTLTSATMMVLDPITVPYAQNFNGVTINHGWNPIDANNDDVTMGINNAITYTYNDNAAADDWMFSPCFNLTAGNYNVSFSYKSNSSLTESFALYYGAEPNVANMTNLIVSEEFNNTTAQTVTVPFTVAQDGVYNFGFHAQSAAGNLGFSIDDFSIVPIINVNVIAGNLGTVTPNGNVAVDYNSNLVLNIVPDDNARINGIWLDDELVSNDAVHNMNFMTYTLYNVTAPHTVNVTFGHQINASVRNYMTNYLGSDQVRGTIAPATQMVNDGESATVTGTLEEHFHLYNLYANGVDKIDEVVFNGNNYSYTIANVDNNYNIEAVVKIDTFGIHYTIQGGDGVIDGHDVVANTTMVTMLNYGDDFLSTFAAVPGYHIVSITVDGVNYGNIDDWQFNFINAEHYVDVVYAPNDITISTTAYGNGTVSAGESFVYDPARTYVFTATPAQGYHIASVLHNDNEMVVANPEATFTDTLTNIVVSHDYAVRFERNFYNVTATAGAYGTVTPAGVTAYNYGTNVNYAINAAIGYYIASVTVDGTTTDYTQADALNSTVITFNNIATDHTVAATFAQYQYTITVNAGANGDIAPATATYAYGATPAFTITPNAGYGIVDVTVDGASVGAVDNYTFTALTADHTIAATFAQYQYTITATAGSNGTITPAGVTNMIHNGNLTYTITPAAGYHIADVYVDGASVGAVSSYNFTNVTANHTIHAMFAANEYTITVNQPAHGTITPGTMAVAHGATPTFVITPAIGYNVATITLNGTNVMANATNVNGVYTYTLPAVAANATLTATMSAKTYTITATAGAHGTIAPAGTTNVNFGGNQAYTITPAAGYVIDQVTVDGINMGAIGAYTFVNVVANHTINATFTYAECEMPSNMHVINLDSNSATLTWYHPGASSFDIQYKALSEATYTSITGVTGSSYDLTNLLPSTNYVWHIQANCEAGNHSEMTNGQIFTTLAAPVAPEIDTTGVENYVQNLVKVYGVNNNIYVVNDNNVNITNIQVYDIYGQLLYNGQANSNPEVISMNVAAGTYMVRLATDKGFCNYKLYLRR